MGYDVTITRQNNWSEIETSRQISQAEWLAVVESDAELRGCGAAEVVSPSGDAVRYENPLLAEWLGHPEGKVVWFDFRRGNVVVKNPDEPVLEKMRAVAELLQARVQSDDGEF